MHAISEEPIWLSANPTDSAHLRQLLTDVDNPAVRYVLEHGHIYAPGMLDRAGEVGECFSNALLRALDQPPGAARYVEGLAYHPLRGRRAWWHAWVDLGNGAAVETTWGQPGTAYIGVPFGLRPGDTPNAVMTMMRDGIIYPALPSMLESSDA